MKKFLVWATLALYTSVFAAAPQQVLISYAPAGGAVYGSIVLTTTGAGTWTVPTGIITLTSVEAIGGGAGNGGAYAKTTYLPVTPGATVYYNVGTAGQDSWVNISSNAAPTVTSQGVLGATNGTTASSVGTTKFAGGASGGSSGGGGGAAGPSGAGGAGATASGFLAGGGGGGADGGAAGSGSTVGPNGGNGGNAGATDCSSGAGGTGGTSTVAATNGTNGGGGGGGGPVGMPTGGNGTTCTIAAWGSGKGPGGGSGGSNGAGNDGNGGNYGGGSVGSTRGQGIIVITYSIPPYQTWSTTAKGAGITLSNGNLTAAGNASVPARVRTDGGESTGQWQFETTAGTNTGTTGVGLITSSATASNRCGMDTHGIGYGSSGNVIQNGGTVATWSSYTTGAVITTAYDADAGTLKFYKNGTLQGTITLSTYSLNGTTLYPCWGANTNGDNATANFGATTLSFPVSGYNLGFW